MLVQWVQQNTAYVSDESEYSTEELQQARDELLRILQTHPTRNRDALCQALSMVTAEVQRRSEENA